MNEVLTPRCEVTIVYNHDHYYKPFCPQSTVHMAGRMESSHHREIPVQDETVFAVQLPDKDELAFGSTLLGQRHIIGRAVVSTDAFSKNGRVRRDTDILFACHFKTLTEALWL